MKVRKNHWLSNEVSTTENVFCFCFIDFPNLISTFYLIWVKLKSAQTTVPCNQAVALQEHVNSCYIIGRLWKYLIFYKEICHSLLQSGICHSDGSSLLQSIIYLDIAVVCIKMCVTGVYWCMVGFVYYEEDNKIRRKDY